MKNLKRLLASILAVAMLFVMSPQKIHADDDGKTLITSMEYNQTEARKTLDLVNAFRTSNPTYKDKSDNNLTRTGLGNLTYDYDLEKVAMQRAAEIAIYFAHTRPDSSNWYTAYTSGYTGFGENIAAGQITAQQVFNDWKEDDQNYAGQVHRRNMLSLNPSLADSGYNAYGAAKVVLDGVTYWVQEFGVRTSAFAGATAAVDTKKTVDISIDYKNVAYLYGENPELRIAKVGDSIDLPNAIVEIRMYKPGTENEQKSSIFGQMKTTWKDYDTSIVKIEGGKIIAQGLGETHMFASVLSEQYGINTKIIVGKSATKVVLKSAPTKTTYVIGQALDTTGGFVTASYDDGTSEDVALSKCEIHGYDKDTLGKQTIEAVYKDYAVYFNVNVIAKAVESISLTTAPSKTSFVEGTNLDVSGGVLKVTNNDGSTKNTALTQDMVSGYDKNKIGKQSLTITYGGKTTKYDVTVTAKPISNITMKTKPSKITYLQGESLDVTGGVISVNFVDGTKKDVTLISNMVSGFDKNKVGKQSLTVTYEGKTTTYEVTVNVNTVSTITLKTNPNKIKFVQGENLDVTGGVLTLNYLDGTKKDATLTSSMVSGYDKNKIGKQTLTITYVGKTTTYDVTVTEKVVSSISLKTMPTKVTYYQGENLDVTGGVVTVHYADGSNTDVTLTSSMVSGYDKNKIGKQTLTITNVGKTTTYDVHVVNKLVTGIALKTKPSKVEYTQGQNLDVTGGVLTVYYLDSTKSDVALTTSLVSGYDKNKVGKQTLTISYAGKTTTYDVTVKDAPIIESVNMHRLYNPNSGEHFYTANTEEKDYLVVLGWKYEDYGWKAPVSGDPVYRLYNPNAGDHHYTVNPDEKDMLVTIGWDYEGIGWYSDVKEEVPLYREYNPNATAGSHNYTTNKAEHDYLVTIGWQGEGIAWYGVK